MQIIVKLVVKEGFEMHTAAVVDTDGRILHTLTRWSEVYARRDASNWLNSFLRGLRA